MAITAYTGLPRNGKSYGVVENVILPAIKSGRTVYTNIPMKGEKWMEDFGSMPVSIDVTDIKNNPNYWAENIDAGSVVVLDEVWRLWAAGTMPNKIRESDKSFFAEHGHMVGDNGLSTEIILVTQDLAQIASFARMLVETTFRVTKLSKAGLDNRFRVDVYTGPVTGPSPPESKKDKDFFGKFEQRIYDLYVSHTLSEGSGKDERVDKRFSLFSGSKIIMFVAFIIFLICGTVYSFLKFSKDFFPNDNDENNLSIESTAYKVPSQDLNLEKSITPIQASSDGVPLVVEEDLFPDLLAASTNYFISSKVERNSILEFTFRVVNDDSYHTLTQDNIINLGYGFEVVSPCLVLLTINEDIYYVGCYNEKSQGFFSGGL